MSSPLQGVTGNVDILKELYNSKAHVLMLGDSISNNGSTAGFTSLFHGALFNWKPLKIKGAYFGTQVGDYSNQGFFIGINGDKIEDQNSDYVEVADPGNNDAFDNYDSNLNGNNSTVAHNEATSRR